MKKIVACAVITLAATSPAFAKGPFDGLQGSWRGSGTLTPVGKSAERTTCTRNATVSNTTLSLQFYCTSASEHFSLSCSIVSQGGGLSGSCTAYNAVITIVSGSVSNGSLRANVRTSAGSSGTVQMTARSMSLSSPNAKKISHLSVRAR